MNFLRIESHFWGASLPYRRLLRRVRASLSDAKHTLSSLLGRAPLTLIRSLPPTRRPPAVEQRFIFLVNGHVEDVPSITEEALKLVAVAEGLDVVVAGALGDSEAADLDGLRPQLFPFRGRTDVKLLRSQLSEAPELSTLGKFVPMLNERHSCSDQEPIAVFPFETVGGGYWLPPGSHVSRRLHRRLVDPFQALQSEESLEGPPTVLFLLPFLAVGGAERLLFDLLAELSKRHRCVVVTVEPHRRHLGLTLDRCAELTPLIFTLGDWLPREAHFGALSHLLRKLKVRSLMSWNGSTFFFDTAGAIRARFPDLRILSQLYHFEGGWTARTSPAVIRAVDAHVAVNGQTRDSLIEQLKIPTSKVAMIHHGVASIPPDLDRKAISRERRRDLGIPENAVVVGSFIRLHPQKRPADILALARRIAAMSLERELWFVLMGGGPLAEMIDQELAKDPIPRLVRLPMRTDPLPFYDALDLCLMTSDYEGLPVFLLDGMARGLPGIAPSVGDIPMLFEQGGGIATGPPGNLERLESALIHYLDDTQRGVASVHARQTIRGRFGLEKYCEAYERLIFVDKLASPSANRSREGPEDA